MSRPRSGSTRRCSPGSARGARQRGRTSIVDVPRRPQLLDVVAGRSAAGAVARGSQQRSDEWRANIAWATLDLSGPYRKMFDTTLPDAVQVADPFHVVKLANPKLDECRRRVQNETLGHRGRKDDPLYRCRRLLTKGRRTPRRHAADTKLLGLLEAGDPRRRGAHGLARQGSRAQHLRTPRPRPRRSSSSTRLGHDLQDESCPPEVRSLGRTIVRWRDQIVAWHRAHTCPTGRPKPPTT